MKYQISESQYKKILLNYLNNIASDFIFEDDEYEGDNWVDVITNYDTDFGSVWFKNIQTRGMITEGCDMELALDEGFIQEFKNTIPIVMPKIFSQVVLEYFNSKTGLGCDCIELPYYAGEYDPNGNPVDQTYHYNANKQ
jgi:hypothetical protein